jgi:UDP-N-acetylmuramate dehydrogenase
MNLPAGLRSKIIKNESTAQHTTFKIGGIAPIWIEPYDLDEFLTILSLLKKKKQTYFIIGAGSNLLIKDNEIKDFFICLKSAHFKRIEIKGLTLKCGAGALLNSLINRTANKSLSGLEYLCGIPATIGGAIYMNASSNGVAVSDYLKEVKIIDKNLNVKVLKKTDINFTYRQSNLKKAIIIEAVFCLRKKNKSDIIKNKSKYLSNKRDFQPLAAKSAGCIFRNPEASELSSGELIEKAGLKGFSVGGAKVSCKHANYIVNFDGATAREVKLLIKKIKQVVKKKFKVTLEKEIIFV